MAKAQRTSLLSALAAVLVVGVLVQLALAGIPKAAYADDGECAILYKSGSLVLQIGTAEDPAMGEVANKWTGFAESGNPPWLDQRNSIKRVIVADPIAPTTMLGWFSNCSNLESADLSKLDTSSVTSMNSTFRDCSSLASLDVSGWNTQAVTDMSTMFSQCSALTSLDVSEWDVSKVTAMTDLFRGCTSLESLDVSRWNTAAVNSLSSVFQGCSSLRTLDVSKWSTESAYMVSAMFRDCSSLESLDLSGWACSNEIAMRDMLTGCSALSSLTLGARFAFGDECGLPDAPKNETHNGRWMNKAAGVSLSAAELMATYDGSSMAGTYVWGTNAAPDDEGGSGDDPSGGGDDHGSGGSPDDGRNPTPSSGGNGEGGSDADGLSAYAGKATQAGFVDLVEADWYMQHDAKSGAFPQNSAVLYIDYAVGCGLMTGLDKTHFGPHSTVTRAQAAMVFFRLANPGAENGTDANATGLPDVESGRWYTRAVNWCFENGVVTGYKDAADHAYAFGPDDPVTREQLAVMVARYCVERGGMSYAGADVSMFSDRAGVGTWAHEGMAFCNAHGIMTGMGGTDRFGVGQTADRAQLAKVIAVAALLLS